MHGLLQTSFFFGYNAVVCFAFFLMLGSVGWRASLLFVRSIYKVSRHGRDGNCWRVLCVFWGRGVPVQLGALRAFTAERLHLLLCLIVSEHVCVAAPSCICLMLQHPHPHPAQFLLFPTCVTFLLLLLLCRRSSANEESLLQYGPFDKHGPLEAIIYLLLESCSCTHTLSPRCAVGP